MNEYEVENMRLEAARDQDHRKKRKKNIPDKIEIFSVNDMW